MRRRPTYRARRSRRERPSSWSAALLGSRADVVEAIAPGDEPALVGEEHEEGVVARERALLLDEARLVDRLGDDARRPGRPGDEQDQAAAADRDRDVGEDPAEPLVARRRRIDGGRVGRAEGLREHVDAAAAAMGLHEAELAEVAADGRLGDGESALVEAVDELLLAGDPGRPADVPGRPGAVALP